MSQELRLAHGKRLIISNNIKDAWEESPKQRWVLFNDEWIDIQNIVQQTLKLPIATNDFVSTYGEFSRQKEVDGLFRAMNKFRGVAATFGEPSALKQKIIANPAYLSSVAPPDEIYGHIVWLANRIYTNSRAFSRDLGNLEKYLDPSRYSKTQRVANLKTVLIGKKGLVSIADEMVKLVKALLTKLDTFSGSVKEAEEQVNHYAGKSSAIMQAAKDAVKDINDKIEKQLRPEAERAESWSKWLLYAAIGVAVVTIVVVSAGLLAPVVGIAAGAVLSGGLYLASQNQKSSYNNLVSEISRQREEVKKKGALVLDLGALNDNVLKLPTKLDTFRKDLEGVKDVWRDVATDLVNIAAHYSPETLSDFPSLKQELKLDDAVDEWQAVGDSVQIFTQNSLISYDFIRFGEKLPAAA